MGSRGGGHQAEAMMTMQSNMSVADRAVDPAFAATTDFISFL
jgi:hypothetical protein